MTTSEEKRIFIGGLVKGVTEEELVEKFSRFGQVSNVDIKTRTNDIDSRTFAYVNLTAEENGFKKCFTAYNNTKWKGGQLKLQYAKESSLSKLKKEQAEARLVKDKEETKPAPVQNTPAVFSDKKAVPGTPMDEKGTWVMGKYSRVVPVLHLRKPTGKTVTVDPSKMLHCLKKLKTDDFDPDKHSDLTWHLEENTSDINKRRQGQFPESKTPKQESTSKQQLESIFARLNELAAEERVADAEMEVVPVGRLETRPKSNVTSAYDSDDSAGSADTDEIVSKSFNTTIPVKKTKESTVTASVKKPKKSTNTGKELKKASDQPADDSPNRTDIETPVKKSTKQSTPKSSVSKKTTSLEEKPQFEFAKTPILKGKALKKSVKLNSSKVLSDRQTFSSDDDNENDSVTKQDTKIRGDKRHIRTPEFKGLSMLSSDSEDNSPAAESEKVKKSKSPELSVKHTKVDTNTILHTPLQHKESASPSIIKGADSKTDRPKKRKALQQVSNDDSDLDDNDFEKVGKKLAERAVKGQENGMATGKEKQAVSQKSGGSSTKSSKPSQNGDSHLPHMQKSHQAYQKTLQEKQKKDSMITKALREGSGGTRIKFSDSDEEKAEEKEPTKISVFSDNDESDDTESEFDFSYRPQFEGSKGRKLLEMQSKITDARFKFDERFMSESEEEKEEEEMQTGETESEMGVEHEKNFQILEKVLGYTPRRRKLIVQEDMTKMRYIPSESDLPNPSPVKAKNKDMNKKRGSPPESDSSHPPQVEAKKRKLIPEPPSTVDSSDDDASNEEEGEVLQSEDDESLEEDNSSNEEDELSEEDESSEEENSTNEEDELSEEEESSEEEDELSEEEEINKSRSPSPKFNVEEPSGLKNLFQGGCSFSFFGTPEDEHNSSDSDLAPATDSRQINRVEEAKKDKEGEEAKEEEAKEEEEEMEIETEQENTVSEAHRFLPSQKHQPVKKKCFMVSGDDPRLQAAVTFFKRPDPEEYEQICEDWPEERNRLMPLVKDRHKKAQRKARKMKQGEQTRMFSKANRNKK